MEAKRRAIEQAEEEVGLAVPPAFNQSMLYQIEQIINVLSMFSSFVWMNLRIKYQRSGLIIFLHCMIARGCQ